MLSKVAAEVPDGGGFLFEPKWDGFRAIVFRGGDEAYIQSRDLRPLDRYFPELHDGLIAALPDGCVVDGEIVIATAKGLDFDLLQLRLHPAASRVAKLAKETPAAFVDALRFSMSRCSSNRPLYLIGATQTASVRVTFDQSLPSPRPSSSL